MVQNLNILSFAYYGNLLTEPKPAKESPKAAAPVKSSPAVKAAAPAPKSEIKPEAKPEPKPVQPEPCQHGGCHLCRFLHSGGWSGRR